MQRLVLLLFLLGGASATPNCPPSCKCSENFEDLFTITCPGLTALMVSNETLQVDCLGYDPVEAPVQLPSVPEVSLTSCPPDAFASPDTKSLFLRNLSTPGRVRVGAWTALQKLDVSSNKLEILSTRFLNGLSSLHQLDLSKCQLHFLYPFCFRDFYQLKELFLEHNELIEIEENQFSNLSNLWLLHLWGNKVSKLSDSSFAGLVELRHLDLSHNRLTTLSPAVLAPMSKLQHLDLSHNRFQTLSGNLLRGNRHLQVFKFEENMKRTAANEPDAEWLQSIELPQGLLSDLSQLSRVSFADSAVATVPRFLLRGSENLTHLDLRGNRLKKIPKFFLQDAGNLRWLDLSENSLDMLSEDLFSTLRTPLNYLNLSSNELVSLPSGEVYKTVQQLDMRDNQLQRVSSDIVHQLQGNEQLRELFFVRGNIWNCNNRDTRELMNFASTLIQVATDFHGNCKN